MAKIAGGDIFSRAATLAFFRELYFFTKMLIKSFKKYLENSKLKKIIEFWHGLHNSTMKSKLSFATAASRA
jgi:hypothetical protein